MKTNIDPNMLAAALVGYERQLETVKQRMIEIRKILGGRGTNSLAAAPARRSRISAAGRARIAAAQRKRWAEAKKMKAAG